jgi:hypothetical protein
MCGKCHILHAAGSITGACSGFCRLRFTCAAAVISLPSGVKRILRCDSWHAFVASNVLQQAPLVLCLIPVCCDAAIAAFIAVYPMHCVTVP